MAAVSLELWSTVCPVPQFYNKQTNSNETPTTPEADQAKAKKAVTGISLHQTNETKGIVKLRKKKASIIKPIQHTKVNFAQIHKYTSDPISITIECRTTPTPHNSKHSSQ